MKRAHDSRPGLLALSCLAACTSVARPCDEPTERLERRAQPPSAQVELPPLDPGTRTQAGIARPSATPRSHRFAPDYPVADEAVYGDGMAMGVDSSKVAALLEDGPVRMDAATAQALKAVGSMEREVLCAALSPDSTKVVCGHARGIITMTDVASGAQVWEYEYVDPDFGPPAEFTNSAVPRDLTFSTDGATVVVVLTPPLRGLFLDASKGRPLGQSAPGSGHMGASARIYWLRDDQILLHHLDRGPLHHVQLDRTAKTVQHRVAPLPSTGIHLGTR